MPAVFDTAPFGWRDGILPRFLGASIVAPGHKQVLPLPPEFIAPQDGAEKQDCERNAAKRWLASHGAAVAHLRPVFLGDDLFACHPIAAAIQAVGGNFILTCKPSSHKTIAEYLHGAELHEHRQTVCKRGKRTTTVYRWLDGVPLRATEDAITVNWFSIENGGQRRKTDAFSRDQYADKIADRLEVHQCRGAYPKLHMMVGPCQLMALHRTETPRAAGE